MSRSMNIMDENVKIDFFDENIPHDRVLVVEEKEFNVISGTLSLTSQFFDNMFNGDFREKNEKKIPLPEVKADDFENFLRAIYPTEFEVDEENLEGLLNLSGRFLSPIVWQKCMKYLKSEENFQRFEPLDLLEWSEHYNPAEFKKRIECALVLQFPHLDEEQQKEMGVIAQKYNLKELMSKVVLKMKEMLDWSPAEYFIHYVNLVNNCPEYSYIKTTVNAYAMDIVNKFSLGEDIAILEGPSSTECRHILQNLLVDMHQNDDFSEQPESENLLRLARQYHFMQLKETICGKLCEQFIANVSFANVEIAVKYNMEPLKNVMEMYLKNHHGALSEETKNILLKSSKNVTRFAFEAMLEHNCENCAK